MKATGSYPEDTCSWKMGQEKDTRMCKSLLHKTCKHLTYCLLTLKLKALKRTKKPNIMRVLEKQPWANEMAQQAKEPAT